MSAATSELSRTYTGLNLGEKKNCKDNISYLETLEKTVSTHSGGKCSFVMDFPSFIEAHKKNSIDTANIGYNMYGYNCYRLNAEIDSFCGNPDYKEAFTDSFSQVVMKCDVDAKLDDKEIKLKIDGKTLNVLLTPFHCSAGGIGDFSGQFGSKLEKLL